MFDPVWCTWCYPLSWPLMPILSSSSMSLLPSLLCAPGMCACWGGVLSHPVHSACLIHGFPLGYGSKLILSLVPALLLIPHSCLVSARFLVLHISISRSCAPSSAIVTCQHLLTSSACHNKHCLFEFVCLKTACIWVTPYLTSRHLIWL